MIRLGRTLQRIRRFVRMSNQSVNIHSKPSNDMKLIHRSLCITCLVFASYIACVFGQVAAPAEPPAVEIKSAPTIEKSKKGQSTKRPNASELKDADEYELMRMFIDTLDEVQRNYVEPISRRELMEAAINGMLSKLDVYSNYIDQEHMDDFRQEVESEFGGIGVQIENLRGRLRVTFPLPGSPARVAGIKAGDIILEVDGTPLRGKSMDQSIRMIKGPIGSEVLLKVRRESGEEDILKVSRGNIVQETVRSHKRSSDGEWQFIFDDDQKIGYIRITSFANNTGDELKEALTQLTEAGMKALILDLRFNPAACCQLPLKSVTFS